MKQSILTLGLALVMAFNMPATTLYASESNAINTPMISQSNENSPISDNNAEDVGVTTGDIPTEPIISEPALSNIQEPVKPVTENNGSISDALITNQIIEDNTQEATESVEPATSVFKAQTLTKTAGSYQIIAQGNMPENAELSVLRVYNTDQLEEVIGDEDYSIYVAFDIEILVDGQVWQPIDDNETVTITATNVEIPEGEELKVYRVEDTAIENPDVTYEGDIVELDATVNADGDIEVETEHFTTYTFGGVTVNVSGTAAYLISGPEFNIAIKNLAQNGTTYRRDTSTSELRFLVDDDESATSQIVDTTITDIVWTTDNLASASGVINLSASGVPVYAIKSTDDNGNIVIKLSTTADVVFFNSNGQGMFNTLNSLTHLSFLSDKIDVSNQ